MFQSSSQDTKIIFTTFILVCLLAIPTFKSLTSNEEKTSSVVAEFKTVYKQDPSRTPASVPPLMPARALAQYAQYDLSCSKKDVHKLVVEGSFIQLQGRNCLKNIRSSEIEIINKSNGFTGSLLFSGANKYQTDMIQLSHGQNEVLIRYRENSGKTVEQTIYILSENNNSI